MRNSLIVRHLILRVLWKINLYKSDHIKEIFYCSVDNWFVVVKYLITIKTLTMKNLRRNRQKLPKWRGGGGGGVDLEYLQTGISGVFFGVFEFGKSVFFWVPVTAVVFWGLLNKLSVSYF